MLGDGAVAVWLIFLSSWGCDTCAYCVGMLLGKHKMAPKLSPKKSVEGGIGGIVGAALLGAIFALAANKITGAGVNPGQYAIICGVGGMISQIGDLAASAIKRNHNIKDYGKLIPGHGGILDRFDSVIFTAPIILLSCNISCRQIVGGSYEKDSNFRFHWFYRDTDAGSGQREGDIEVLGLAAGSNIKVLEEQIREFHPQIVLL